MSYHDRKTFFLISDRVRQNAIDMIRVAAPESVVTVSPKARTTEQNAKLHAMLSDLARSDLMWAGKRRTMEEWKALIISAHAVATKHGGEVIPGIEGEFVAIRESSATMSVSRAASLIEYLTAFCVSNGVDLRDVERGGFNHEPVATEPPSPSVETDGSEPEQDVPLSSGVASTPAGEPEGAGAETADGQSVAPAPEDFTPEEWKWIRSGTRMIWAATEKGYQETVDNQVKAIVAETPAEIGKPARDKLGSIRKQCKLVCFGELDHGEGRRIVAALAGVTEDELREVEP